MGEVLGERTVVGHEDGGDDAVAEGERLAGGIGGDVVTEGDDFAGAFVAEDDGNEAEGVALVFVHVGAADTAAFDLNEDFAFAEGREGEFADFDGLGAEQDGRAGRGGRECAHILRLIIGPNFCA